VEEEEEEEEEGKNLGAAGSGDTVFAEVLAVRI
jgi:hypothetical protein